MMRRGLTRPTIRIVLLLIVASTAFAQAGKRPLSVDEVERLLKGQVQPARIAQIVGERGVSFELTTAVRERLQQAGADAEVLGAIDRAGAKAEAKPTEKLEAEERPPPAEVPRRTALVVRTNVSGDEVLIDGRSVGPSGSTPRDVEPGRHGITARREGYRTVERDVIVGEGETKEVRLELKPVEAAASAPARREEPVSRPGMVVVPGGPFLMGCNESVDSECDEDEKPSRTVEVPAFRIDKTEVTADQYRKCVQAGSCEDPDSGGECNWNQAGRGTHPINCVNWNDAKSYCEWTGKRLPTESEWEKAARGTDGRRYPWGNSGFLRPAGWRISVTRDASSTGRLRRTTMAMPPLPQWVATRLGLLPMACSI